MTTVGMLIRPNVLSHSTYMLCMRSASLININNHHVLRSYSPLKYDTVSKHKYSMVAMFHSGKPLQVEGTGKRPNLEKNVKENLDKLRKGQFDTMTNPEDLSHFRKGSVESTGDMSKKDEPPIGTHALPHPIWSQEEVHAIEITHKTPENLIDRLALMSVKTVRAAFDLMSGYSWRERTEQVWLTRIIFLETVAGVPGMVAAMTRHFHSLRRMRRDHGWIHTLLEEAENERMHLMTALHVKKPGILFRTAVVVTQGIFVNTFFLAYLLSPRFCHRFVGYLEEEAVRTYTKCLQDIETGPIQQWKTQPAPAVAKTYWKLSPDATMKDVILAIRADEAHHRVVNHTLGSMKPDDYNPYKPGE